MTDADRRSAGVAVREARPDEHVDVRQVVDAAMLEPGDVAGAIDRGDALVAVADGNVVGALVLDRRENGAHVEAVAVRRARRGQGIGTALVESAAERAEHLTAVFDPGVRPFYESLGFEIEPADDDGERMRGTRD
ncbi:GNAT family N-acetyltransferase [Halostella sp. JP-L12]|uniref:GNAT family N-acetyltransferase n=1 Tax=Halostella TaxID=1843185 RepID=UPI000EF7C930|nr:MULTISPECIES: GNAT family N-acetyltransferase [Halostella]NHN46090.1 GNAT family N-acetyltransferase [Halostella sp. JP-L12]